MSERPGGRPRRQHFVPRLLLKGFAHRVKGKGYYVFEFRRGSEPHEVNIINVGVARDFYGRPEENDLERKLSLKEAEYATLVHNLRDGRVGPEQKPLIDDFVTHLIVRTKNLRDGFIELALGMFDAFERVISTQEDRGRLEQKIIRDLFEDPQLKPLLALFPAARRRELLLQVLSRAGLAPVPTFQKLLQLARPNLDVKSAARSAQLRALGMEDALLKRRESLAPLVWSIFESTGGSFVLGDVGPVARFSESPELQSPLKFGTTPEAIFLPLSKQHLLIGQSDRVTGGVNVETVNIASAELSRDLFVAGSRTDRELEYRKRLGRRAAFLDEAEMDEGLRQAFE